MWWTFNGASLSLRALVSLVISLSWSKISWLVLSRWDCKFSFAVLVSDILCWRAELVQFQEVCMLFAFCVIVFLTWPRSQVDFALAPNRIKHHSYKIWTIFFWVNKHNVLIISLFYKVPWDSLIFWFVCFDHVPGILTFGSRFSTPPTNFML